MVTSRFGLLKIHFFSLEDHLMHFKMVVDLTQFPSHPNATQGYPTFENWPRWNDVSHQQAHIDWLRAAFEGGLRIVGISAVNNDILCHILEALDVQAQSGDGKCDDEHNLLAQIDQVISPLAYASFQTILVFSVALRPTHLLLLFRF